MKDTNRVNENNLLACLETTYASNNSHEVQSVGLRQPPGRIHFMNK